MPRNALSQDPAARLPEELRPTAEVLVAELRHNPLLAGFSGADLFRLVSSNGYRRTLEREHRALQSGFRHGCGGGGRVSRRD